MAAGIERFEDLVPDSTGHHVDHQVGVAVVGRGCVFKVEIRWCGAVHDVEQMDIMTRLPKFSSDERAHQSATEAMNSHGLAFDDRNSKVAVCLSALRKADGRRYLDVLPANVMSILEKYEAAFTSGDKEQLDALIHDDCKFYPHVGGAVMTTGDIMAFAGMGAVTTQSHRILFETDEVGVGHSISHFANGSTSEAVLAFYRYKDGKIIHVETGATPLSDDYKLIGQ